jgi:hypothetical protein
MFGMAAFGCDGRLNDGEAERHFRSPWWLRRSA